MNTFSEQLKKEFKNTHLSNEKKGIMKAELKAFMDLHKPHVNSDVVFRLHKHWGIFSRLTNNLKPMIAGLLIAALLGGSVSFAAEGSVPGDILYPVKVSVNEPVRAAVSISTEAKAEWEARRAERRLEEAEKLAERGETEAEVEARLEANFAEHADRVKERIAVIEARGDVEKAAQLAARFETSLKAHELILARVQARGEDDKNGQVVALLSVEGTSTPMIIRIGKIREEFKKERERTEEKVKKLTGPEAEAAVAGRATAARNKIDEAKRLIERLSPSIEAELVTKANARIAEAEKAYAEGSAKIATKEYKDAFEAFSKAHRLAQEAQFAASAQKEFRIKLLNGDDDEEDLDDDRDDDGDGEDDEDEDEDEDDKDGDDEDDVKVETRARIEL